MIKQNFYKKIWCCLLLNWVLHLVLKKHDTQYNTQFNKFGHSIYQFQQELLSAWELQKALKNGKIKYVCCTWLLLVPQRLKFKFWIFFTPSALFFLNFNPTNVGLNFLLFIFLPVSSNIPTTAFCMELLQLKPIFRRTSRRIRNHLAFSLQPVWRS